MKKQFRNAAVLFFLFSLLASACSQAVVQSTPDAQLGASADIATGEPVADAATETPAATATSAPNLVIGRQTLGQLRQFWSAEFVGDPEAEYGCEWNMVSCTYVSQITDYAFSPDGTTLAVGVCLGVRTVDQTHPEGEIWGCTEDSAIILYDSVSGEEQARFAPTTLPLALAYHPNGDILAVGLVSSDIEIWDVSSGELSATLPGPDPLTDAFPVEFALDGERLMTGGGQPTVTNTPTGRKVVGATITVWDWQAAEVLTTIERVTGIAISPDGTQLATNTVGNEDGDTVRIYDLTQDDVYSGFIPADQFRPENIYFDPITDWIATIESGFDANLVNFWDPQSYELVDSFNWDEDFDVRGFLYNLNSGGFTSDGYFLLGQDGPSAGPVTDENGQELMECSFALADIQANQIYFVSDPMTFEECEATYSMYGIETLILSPDGKFIAGEDGFGSLRLWGIDANLPAVEPACYGDC